MGKKSYVWDGTAWVVFTGTTTYPVADTSGTQGVVSLVNSTSSTSTTTAAVPASVKSSYDLAAAAVPKSTVTTAGDIIYGTGSAAVTRLGIGTAGQVLTVNAGATAPQWSTAASGGMTLIGSAAVSSGAVITFSSIPATYKHLRLVVDGYNHASAGSLRIRLNGVGSSAYFFTDTQVGTSFTYGYGNFRHSLSADLHSVAANCTGFLNIYDYATSNQNKLTDQSFYYKSSASAQHYQQYFGSFNSTAGAITSVDVANGSFPTTAGNAGTIYLYGVS